MPHSHSHHGHDHGHDSRAKIGTAFCLNLGFTVIELAGGLLTNSVAIMADALHDLGDSLALGTAWFLARFSERDRDVAFTYGYKRFSLLGALINALVLAFGSIFILWETIPRLLSPEATHAPGMIGLAVLGVLVNGAAVWVLRGGRTMNERVVTWHLFEDVLGWLAVGVVGTIMLFWDAPILDPILSILITFYILWNVGKALRQTLAIFLQGVPRGFDIGQVEEDLAAIEGVASVHHTHLWSQEGEHHVLTTHLVCADGVDLADLYRIRVEAKSRLREMKIQHSTVELEIGERACADGPNGEEGCGGLENRSETEKEAISVQESSRKGGEEP